MIKKTIPVLAVLLVLASIPFTHASTSTNIDIKVFDFSESIGFFDSRAFSLQEVLVESDFSYDESKDATERRGTENWEQSQSGFFVVPGVILGILALILFFDRK